MPPEPNRFSIYTDEELMLYITQGEPLAFDELYERYGRRLMVYFTRMLNYHKEHAEDALHDLFLKLAQAPEKFDRSRSFKTWIYSVAFNSCKNYYRHLEVVKQSKEELGYEPDYEKESDFMKLASKLDGTIFGSLLQKVLNSLAPEKKEAFLLKYQEEKSISEIAEIQNCPEGSVKSRLHYTLKILEEKLKEFNPHL